ncbi:hypothetical protein BGX31_002050 [Mortierella sp. GBA43]|nr:hypothetical protein BGX31_002050 [Mortierella sp. GBA43]
MGKLEKLERLRRLDISKLPGLKMGLQEGEWIRDHWPLLEYLDLEHFHKDQSTHDMMVIYLDKNRPKLKLSLSLVDANLKNHIEEMGLVEKCMMCKTWEEVLKPQLWNTLCVGARSGGKGYLYKLEHLDTLEQHLHFVRHLEIAFLQSWVSYSIPVAGAKVVEDRLKTMLVRCQGLIKLKTNVLYEELFQTIERNRETMVRFELTSSDFMWDPNQRLTQSVWKVLSDDDTRMNRLRHLKLYRIQIRLERGRPALDSPFAKLCQRLETLECTECSMNDWLTSLPTVSPSTVEKDSGKKDDRPPWSLKRVEFGEAGGLFPLQLRFFNQSHRL